MRDLFGGGDSRDTVLLRMPAGDIPVRAAGDVWTLTANAPKFFPSRWRTRIWAP